MIPVGFMLKKVAARPDWIKSDAAEDIYSLSSHVSANFADYINYWKHNGYWLFDSPEVIEKLTMENDIKTSEMTLFYYEAFEKEYDVETEQWSAFSAENSFTTNVVKPTKAQLHGYDVVTFSVHTSPECSPLSCNNLAEQVAVNRHCLLGSFDDAKRLIEEGAFDDTEPGPFRIFAVYTVGR